MRHADQWRFSVVPVKRTRGEVLLQDNHPVAYSSRSLMDTETRYAQIEKEMRSIVHA